MRHLNILKKLNLLFITTSLLCGSLPAWAQTGISAKAAAKAQEADYDLSKLTLPSEVKSMGKGSGSIFYSPSIKGKVLIPVHFWGYFTKPGLHFVPVESTLLEGVSYAGGPNPSAKIDNVRLMRKSKVGSISNSYFDLEKGGTNEAALLELRPGDMVFVEKDHWYENRAYYTSLIGVVATILSSILLYRQVQKN